MRGKKEEMQMCLEAQAEKEASERILRWRSAAHLTLEHIDGFCVARRRSCAVPFVVIIIIAGALILEEVASF